MLKKIVHFIEGAGVGLAFLFFRYLLSFKYSTTFGGWIGRTLGPRFLPRSSLARRNIKKCFPHLTEAEVETILVEMWDNYGRLIIEYMNPEVFWDGKTLHNIEIMGVEHLKNFFEDGKPGILFTAHTGNWQMILLAARSLGYDVAQFYKSTTNPWTDMFMQNCQKRTVKKVITKQGTGLKDLLSLLKRKEHALLLVDQKAGDGRPIPFLGHRALTAAGWARLALTQACPLLPTRSERLSATTFRVTFYPPITLVSTGNREKDIDEFLLFVNTLIGEWVTERPGQWFWLHRRWKGLED